MSRDAVARILQDRSQFLKHLKEEVAKTDAIIDANDQKLKDLKITTDNVKELGKKVEHSAMIPLGKRIYVDGKIVHTGEYYLDKLAFPDSYSTLETLDDTIKHLENKIKKQSELLKESEEAKEQLESRIKLTGDGDGLDDDLPQEIVSDRGVAVKAGDFYEIVEFEN